MYPENPRGAGIGPPPLSAHPFPIYLKYLLRAQFISNLGPEWTGSHHSKEGFQVSERGIEKGARGINKGKKRARGLRHAY
jgi:hypothetical protein